MARLEGVLARAPGPALDKAHATAPGGEFEPHTPEEEPDAELTGLLATGERDGRRMQYLVPDHLMGALLACTCRCCCDPRVRLRVLMQFAWHRGAENFWCQRHLHASGHRGSD